MENVSLKLKTEGNDLFKQERYEEAVTKYTEALKHDPDNAVLYSNRSLSYLKLTKYHEALSDSIECIKHNPQWIKGYVRQTLAHQGLGNHAEVMKSAEDGFKVCTEATIKRDIVQYWLTSNQAINALPEGYMELPRGVMILSKQYMEILACLIQSLNGERPLNYELSEHCLCACAEEIEAILKKFGENTSAIIKEWSKLLLHEIYPYYVEPAQKKAIRCQMKARSDSLVEFFHKEIDPTLYPILRPIFGLIVLIILNRSNILTECNASHHAVELMNQALFPLFDSDSILSHEDYYSLYIGRLCCFLDSFIGRGARPSKEDIDEIQLYCQKLQKAIQSYPRHLPEFQKDSEMATTILSNVRQNILLPPSTRPPDVPIGSTMSVEIAERVVHEKPTEVQDYVTKRLKSLEAVDFLTMGEIEEMITMAGIFHQLCDKNEALRVFTYGEKAFFQVFGHLLSSHTLTLDQCPSAITQIRQLVLNQALLFPTLFPDITLRWKCLFKELRLQLIQRSPENIFGDFFHWYTSQVTTKTDTSLDDLLTALRQHLKKEEQILESEAKAVLTEQSTLSYKDLQSVLDDDMVAVDYVFFAPLQKKNKLLEAYCVICQAQEKPIVCSLDFNAIRTHSTRLFYLLSHELKSDEFLKAELLMLSNTLFPKCLLDIFATEKIKRVYISPDFDISKIPLDILPLSFDANGQKPLYEILSVSILSSMKQLIAYKRKAHTAGDDQNVLSTKSCCLVGKPNFDLTTVSTQESLYEKLLNSFCSYLNISPPSGPLVEPLHHSESEIDFISFRLQQCGFDIKQLMENDATFNNVISIDNPLLLHISSHASGETEHEAFRGNFFSDLKSAIILAGFNTFSKKQFHLLPKECGPAQLPLLAIYSMKLKRTKLVFISTCNSAAGESPINEAVNSLADAFITMGVETVIATLWTVSDESAATFTKYVYDKLVQPGVRPSQAIAYAKATFLLDDKSNQDWICPAAFVCYGIDNPLVENV